MLPQLLIIVFSTASAARPPTSVVMDVKATATPPSPVAQKAISRRGSLVITRPGLMTVNAKIW